MRIHCIRKGVTPLGDDIEIRDHDGRFIVVKRQDLKELVNALRRYKIR